MDPKGYRLPINVMKTLSSLILNGQLVDMKPSSRPELAERKRFINDFIAYVNGTPNYS